MHIAKLRYKICENDKRVDKSISMNMKKYILFFTVLALGLMISCDNEKIVSYYSTATISSFKFASNDSFPGLAEATFVVDNLPDTGRIYLKDSIRYGTPLDSVVPVITFTNTVSGAVYYFPDTTIHYTEIGRAHV